MYRPASTFITRATWPDPAICYYSQLDRVLAGWPDLALEDPECPFPKYFCYTSRADLGTMEGGTWSASHNGQKGGILDPESRHLST